MSQTPPTKTCTQDGCGKAHRARGLCSTHYNHKYQPNRHAATQTACTVCGKPIARPASSVRRPACSVQCRAVIEFGHATGVPSGYDWKTFAARRARDAGATVVHPFDRETVFERDNWTCYLCSLPVLQGVSAFDPNSATVDHVIPLSRGGEHSVRNARTAHLRCNSAKQDRTLDSVATAA
jgi:HNH endonuclease